MVKITFSCANFPNPITRKHPVVPNKREFVILVIDGEVRTFQVNGVIHTIRPSRFYGNCTEIRVRLWEIEEIEP